MIVEAYSGFEPQVGEILAVRTFRIGPDGSVYPLFAREPWVDGANTARCRAVRSPDGDGSPPDAHPVVDPECTCGFYAYAHEQGASENPHARHVLAVVACWGRVIAGTRGLRSEHCRIVAMWMSHEVPSDLVAAVAARYPSVAVYRDRSAMLAAHPTTALDCFAPPPPPVSAAADFGLRIGVGSAVVIGLLPRGWLTGNSAIFGVWLSWVGVFLAVAVLYGRRDSLADKGRALLDAATVLWLLAPLTGPAGYLLLRLPLLQTAALAYRHRRRLTRAASRFPADIS